MGKNSNYRTLLRVKYDDAYVMLRTVTVSKQSLVNVGHEIKKM
jgi:hypothetical protein